MATFNPDLAREILLEVEKLPPSNLYADLTDENYTSEEISYHFKMLAQDNLVEAIDRSTLGKFYWKVRSLTPEGHRFLDAIRNDNDFAKAKSAIVKQGIQMSWTALKAVVSQGIRDNTGIEVPL